MPEEAGAARPEPEGEKEAGASPAIGPRPDDPVLLGDDEPEYVEELPTMPPAPGGKGATLRWATTLRHDARSPVLPARSVPPAGSVLPARSVPPAGSVLPARSVPPAGSVLPARSVPPARSASPGGAATPTRSTRPPGAVNPPPRSDRATGPMARYGAPPANPSPPPPAPWPAGAAPVDLLTVPVPAVDPAGAEHASAQGAGTGPRAGSGSADGDPAGQPRRRLRGRGGLAVFAVLVAAALALAVAGLVGTSNGPAPRRPAPGPGPAPVSLKGDTPAAVFRYLVTLTSDAGQLAHRALSGACQEQPPGSAGRQGVVDRLSQAAGMDRTVLSLLAANGARLTTVADSTALVSLLGQVARASAAADASYALWVKDLEATGCYSAPTNDLYYQKAERESTTAESALKRVDALWDQAGGRPTAA